MSYLYFGGRISSGNPGFAGCAAVVYDSEMKEKASTSYECGLDKSNNYATFMGLVKGIELLHYLDIKPKDTILRCDSSQVIKQCRGEYKVTDDVLLKIFTTLNFYLHSTEDISHSTILDYFKDIQKISRNENHRVDILSNTAINRGKRSQGKL